MTARLPLLTIVTGRPGAGKSTLARELASRLRCPMLSRDEVKEGLIRTIGTPDDIQILASDAFFSVAASLIGNGVSFVAEAAFQHKVWLARLESFLAAADIRIVVCDVPAELARARALNRSTLDRDRDTFHPREDIPEDYDPPRLSVPTLKVDTSQEPDFDVVLSFLG